MSQEKTTSVSESSSRLTENEVSDSPKQDTATDQSASSTDESLSSIEEHEYPGIWVRSAIFTALLLGEFLIALDLTIVATAIPRITDEFKSIEDVGWYGSAFFLTFAAFQSGWGKVYKYFAMKHAFFWSVVIFAVGTLICALAPQSVALIIGRAVTGVGAAGVTNGVYTITACIVPPKQVAMYLALVGVVFSIASVIGPLLGGALTQSLSWRWVFWISLPIAGASLAVVLLFFRTPEAMKSTQATGKEKFLQMDLQGTVLVISSLLCYMMATQWGGVSLPWHSSTIIGLLVGWILLGACFVLDQWWQGDRAQITPRIIKDRTVAGLCSFIVLLNGTTFLMIYYLPIYFQAIDNASPANSGVRSVPLILSMSIALLASSSIVTWIGYYHPLLFVGGILITVGSGLIYTLDIGSSTGQYIGYQIVAGVGNGICSQIPLIVCIAFSKPQDIALATATVLFFQLISGAISVTLAQCLFTNVLLQKLPEYAPTIDPARVIAVGASELRGVFSAEELPGILRAYMAGIKAAWAAAIALGGLSVLVALVPKYRSIHSVNRSTTTVAIAA